MWAIYFVNKEFNVYRDGGEGEKYKKFNFSTELFMYILVTLRSILSQCFYILYSMFPRFMVYIYKTELRQRLGIRKSVAPLSVKAQHSFLF